MSDIDAATHALQFDIWGQDLFVWRIVDDAFVRPSPEKSFPPFFCEKFEALAHWFEEEMVANG